jgi:AbrB family looped-hinge helix DNA binding protein
MKVVTLKNIKNNLVKLRPKRQVTLPKSICDKLGIVSGDDLELSVEGQTLIVRPRKTRSLEALQAIQTAFQNSGISEKELLASGRRVRKQLASGRHGK